ncbi:hypothetical protein F4820DRAFT_432717 [Hypoxylon rubiginosum]|uniref:Uncharacterized protein n=1 Tax=Hypoxylon rubiginosum TaxID=110542 RepID=A0ACB9YRW9_9PEZI|nr:hypothetical protein F4820DRAFT_432717 [Hypoxylon rubiginosum]
MDHCRNCNEQSIRGWVLNGWLERFYKKKVWVIVSLDSCHSGEAWRSGSQLSDSLCQERQCRTPKNFTRSSARGSRDAQLEDSWGMNPERFTLMTACQRGERADEHKQDNEVRGIFSYALVSYVRKLQIMEPYHIICEHIADRMGGNDSTQKPLVWGQEHLLFFGREKSFPHVPIRVKIDGQDAILPVGRIHGVKINTEFTSRTFQGSLVIKEVMDGQCKTKPPSPEFLRHLGNEDSKVYFSRWASEESFQVFIEPRWEGPRFQELLKKATEEKIFAEIEVSVHEEGSELKDFKLIRGKNTDIGIVGPKGYEGGLCGLKIESTDIEERARKSALALAHLFRFRQLLDLKKESSGDSLQLDITGTKYTTPQGEKLSIVDIVPEGTETIPERKEIVPKGTQIRLELENKGRTSLYFRVVNFTPGFKVAQMYPKDDTSQEVPGPGKASFKFRMDIPKELDGKELDGKELDGKELDGKGPFRDIFRVVIFKEEGVSLRPSDLTPIWDAMEDNENEDRGLGRDGTLVEDLTWWIKDVELWTERQPSKGQVPQKNPGTKQPLSEGRGQQKTPDARRSSSKGQKQQENPDSKGSSSGR